MTSSYHEISYRNTPNDDEGNEAERGDLEKRAQRLLNRARNWVGDLSLEGVVSQEGQQVNYVVADLQGRIKISSPKKQSDSTCKYMYDNSSPGRMRA